MFTKFAENAVPKYAALGSSKTWSVGLLAAMVVAQYTDTGSEPGLTGSDESRSATR